MMEDDGGDARLWIHHAAIGQLDADVRWAEDPEEDLLIVEARAGRVAKRIPLAVIVRLEPIEHRRIERIRKAPLAAQRAVEELRVCFRGLERQGLQEVRLEEVAVLLRLLGAGADPFSGGGDEETDAVVLADVIGETEPVLAFLPREGEPRELRAVGAQEQEVVAVSAGAEELVDGARLHRAFTAFLLEIVEALFQEERLPPRLGLLEDGAIAVLHIANDGRLQSEMAPVD